MTELLGAPHSVRCTALPLVAMPCDIRCGARCDATMPTPCILGALAAAVVARFVLLHKEDARRRQEEARH